MALSADKEAKRSEGTQRSYSVYQSTTIYKGGLVVLNSTGYAIAGVDTASVKFVGVATENIDNSTGASGAKFVVVDKTGEFEFTMTSNSTQALVGTQVYITDDTTVNSTSTNTIKCGFITEYVSATKARVRIDADVQ